MNRAAASKFVGLKRLECCIFTESIRRPPAFSSVGH